MRKFAIICGIGFIFTGCSRQDSDAPAAAGSPPAAESAIEHSGGHATEPTGPAAAQTAPPASAAAGEDLANDAFKTNAPAGEL